MCDMITLHEAMGKSISHLFYGKVEASKEGREEEEEGGKVSTFTDHLKEMYQNDETEVMQVEGGPPSFQGGFGQDEEMQSREEGGTPHKEAEADTPEFNSDVAKMPVWKHLKEHSPPPPPPPPPLHPFCKVHHQWMILRYARQVLCKHTKSEIHFLCISVIIKLYFTTCRNPT